MPLCIAGMHRSGTSMIARLLNLCGLYLGNEQDLMPPQPDNPEGFWEHTRFVSINDAILSSLGGGWDFPPALQPGWSRDPGLAPLFERARLLTSEFTGREPWGWKDPRNSLTIDFWKTIMPDLKVVLCLRHPQEVVQSLHKRGYNTNAFGYNLWSAYNRIVLSSLQPGQYIVTQYESYFIDPLSELRRLAAFAGLSVSEEQLHSAAATVKTELRRNRASAEGLPRNVEMLYDRLRTESSTEFRRPTVDAVSNADQMYEQAQNLMRQGNPDGAFAALKQMIALHPDHALAHNDLGVLSLQREQTEEALAHYLAATRLNPDNITFKKNLADFLFVKMGQAEQSLALYGQIIASRPDDVESLLTAGNICISLSRFGQASSFFDQVLKAEPDNIMAQQVLTAMREKGLLAQEQEARPAVSIIIPVYNHVEYTARCLDSVAKSLVRERHVEIIVVDDASTDGSEEFIRTVYGNHADLHYIRHAENGGFAKTCNTGARTARGKFLVFLNNDTALTPGWLDELLDTIERHPDTGIVGSKLVFPEAAPGPQGERVQHCGIAFNEKKESLHLYKFCLANQPFVNKPREVQAVTAAALLIPRDLFIEVGCFDEAYRNGAEDLDLCFKVRARGRKVRYCPESIVYHYESVSTGGGYSANTANYKLFLVRWSEQIRVDEYDHYREDGLALPPPNGLRVAMLTPLGPQKTGIGTYMEELLPYLSQHMMVDLFVDDIVPTDPVALARHRVHRISDLEYVDWIYHYDEFLYQIGNNNFHSAIYRMAAARPGIVVLHEYDSRGCTTEISARIFLQKLFGVAKGVIVHNEHSRDLLQKEFPDLPFAVIPLLVSPKTGRVQIAGAPSARDRLQIPPDCYCIVSLGLVQPHKRNHVTVEAFARVVQQHPNSMLLLAGDAPSQAYRAFVEKIIARHGLSDKVRITGWLSEDQFFDYLDAADVTVNLRYPSRGEESATLIRILGSGKPAVISHYAQYIDIPDDCAVRIGFQNEQNDLADALIRLGRDKASRDQLSGNALRFISKRNSGERVAQLHEIFCREMKSLVPGARVLRERRYHSPSRSRTPLLWEAPFQAFSDPARELVLAIDRSGIPSRIVTTPGEAADAVGLNHHDSVRLRELEAMPLADEFIQIYAGRLDAFRKRPGAVYSIAFVDHTTLPAGEVPAKLPVDELWVPSQYSKRMLVSRGIPENKITVIPYGVGAVPFGAAVNELPLEGPFRFLCVADRNRKSGWNDVLTAFLQEFGGRKDVSLVFKSIAPYGDIAARNQQFQSEVDQYLRTHPPIPDDHLRTITFDPKTYGPDIMPAFYSQYNAFVHPALDTALGRSLMETMALGLPVITTAAAGQADFCTSDNSHLVHHRPAKDGVETDVQHLRKLMRFLVDERLSSQVKGIVARNDILGHWTWNDAAAKAAQRIKEILTSPGPQSSQRSLVDVRAGATSHDAPAVPPSISPHSEGSSSSTLPVIWHAPIYDPSGYADEARHFLLALADKGFDIAARPIGRLSEQFRAGLDPAHRDRLDHMISRKSEPNAISIVHFPAYAFQRIPGASYHIGRVMFETDGLPQDWVTKCNEMDEIWVPSEFNRETFSNAGVTTKLTRIPAGIDTKRFRPGVDPLPIDGRRATVFLSIFEWTYRKGWDVLLSAWARAFRPDDDVCLVLRAYPVNVIESKDNAQVINERIDQYLRNSLGLARKDVAPIIVMGEQIAEADLPRLYAAAAAYVAPSRGEGWGRPHMEAMACGLPVIATNWSGSREFMTVNNSYLLNIAGLVEIDERAEIPFYRGQRWAEPDPDHLVQLMQDIATQPEEARRIGARARQDMEQSWTWVKQADRAADRLREIFRQLSCGQVPDRAGSPTSLAVRWEGSQFVRHSLALVNREICIRLAKDPSIELSVIPYEKDQFTADSDKRFALIVQNLRRPLSRSVDVHVRHQWPPNLSPPDEGHWVLMQPWEFGSIPKQWKDAISAHVDEVWAYTAYGRDVYVQSGVPADRVHIIPLGVNCERFSPSAHPLDLRTKKLFKFLFVGGTIHRKGIDVLLKAYTETFSSTDDVCLVIKDMGGDSFYQGQTAQELIARAQSAVNAPEIEYIDRFLSDDELAGLYTACNCLVHPYRGEGFGLPIAEAMACGLPAVVTGYGAALDFCSTDNAYLLPYQLVRSPEKKIGDLETVDYPWLAEPDPDSLKETMRHVIAHPDEARSKGKAARLHIETNFTWEKSSETVTLRLRALSQRPVLRRVSKGHSPKQRTEGLVSIIVRISKDLEAAKACLESITKCTREPYEIVFLVPGSSPQSVTWAKKIAHEHANILYLEIPDNLGFAKECNQGIKASTGERILLLAPRVMVTENWLLGMLECLNSATDIGIVGPMSDRISGPQKVPSGGDISPTKLIAYAREFHERHRYRRVSMPRIASFCMLFDHSLVERIGLFDERFASENLAVDDYCLRSILLGYRNMISADVFVHTAGTGKSLDSGFEDAAPQSVNGGVFAQKWSGIDKQSPLGKRLSAVNALDRAWEFHYRGETDRAAKAILEGIKLAPDDRALYYGLVEILLDAKQFKDALDVLKEMPGVDHDVRKLLLSGYCEEGLEHDDRASDLADRALALDASSAVALNLKGILAYKKNDRDAAERFFKLSREADPAYGEPCTNLGVLLWATDHREEALDLLERGCILSPTVTDIVTTYHTAITAVKEYGRAEWVFRENRSLYPLDRRTTFLLIDVLLKQEKYDVAMAEIEKAMVLFGIDDGILAAALDVRKRIGPQDRIKETGKKNSLSLCMIVKNEEQNLASCLTSIKPIADELIIVDTGSIDRTRDIASAFGAKVLEFPWTGDFSEARNVSLEKASGDWILVLDADEVLAAQDIPKLMKLLEKKGSSAPAYSFVTRNYVTPIQVAGWTANDGTYAREEKGTGWFVGKKVRLFPRDLRIRFSNPVHEMVEPSLKEIGKRIQEISVPIHHYGKLDEEKNRSKGEEYYQLGRKKIEERPDDLAAIRELAIQAGELKKFDDAIALWQRAITLKPDLDIAYLNMTSVFQQMDRFDDALAASRKALEFKPEMTDAACNNALSEIYAGSIERAVAVLEKVVRKEPGHPSANIVLAVAYILSGQGGKGVEMFQAMRFSASGIAEAVVPFAKKLMVARRYEFALSLFDAVGNSAMTDEIRSMRADCIRLSAPATISSGNP